MRDQARKVALVAVAIAGFILPASASASGFEPLGSFGAPGPGAGQLQMPSGISVDGAGTVAIADQGSFRISRFDGDGNFRNAFGYDVIPGGGTGFENCTTATTCKTGVAGSGPGQFAGIYDVSVSPAGDRVIAPDASNSWVSQFGGEPSFLRAWGYDTIPGGSLGFERCTAATGCKAAAAGAGLGQFASPLTATYMASGNVLVLDAIGRFQEFTADGVPVRGFGSLSGSGPGNLNTPYDVAPGPAGELIVSDTANYRISVFSPAGSFQRAFGWDVIPGLPVGFEVCTIATNCKSGAPSPGAGGLAIPTGLAVGPGGEIYVAETAGNRISQFTIDGQFVRAFGFDVIPGGPGGFETCTAATGCAAGTNGAAFGELNNPYGVGVNCRGTVYVTDMLNARVNVYGEPGVRKAPCPSNAFTLGTAKVNKKKGTAKLPVTVPGPGALSLAGKDLKVVDAAPTVAGEVKLAVKAKGKLRKKLKQKGKAKAKPQVTFTPTNGDPNTLETKVKLQKKLK